MFEENHDRLSHICVAIITSVSLVFIAIGGYMILYKHSPLYGGNDVSVINNSPVVDSVPVASDTQASETISDRWYRAHLEPDKQSVYDAMEDGIREMKTSFKVPEVCTDDDILNVFESLMNDCPELFWVGDSFSHKTSGTSGKIYEIIPKYNCTSDEKKAIEAKIDDATDSIYLETSKASTDYNKAKVIWDWLCDNVKYDESSANSQNIAGVFNDGVTACAGYSRAFMYLCNKVGINCIYVSGVAYPDGDNSGTFHAWNAYTIDDTVVYCDITWGDRDDSPTDYSWFCLSKSDMKKSHEADDDSLLPEGDSERYEIWSLNNSRYDTYDENTVVKKLSECRNNGDACTSIRFNSTSEAKKAFEESRGSSMIASKLIALQNDSDVPFDSAKRIYSVYLNEPVDSVVWIWRQ